MGKLKQECIFCDIIRGDEPSKVVYETEDYICFYSVPPVNEGHTLVVPKVHVTYMQEHSDPAIYQVIEHVQQIIKEEYNPDATNIGINNGTEAGQTIPHLHWHIIPRYEGDMENPAGGIRGVIPDKQKYS